VGFVDFHDKLQELQLRVDVVEDHPTTFTKLPACMALAVSFDDIADVDGWLVLTVAIEGVQYVTHLLVGVKDKRFTADELLQGRGRNQSYDVKSKVEEALLWKARNGLVLEQPC